MFMATSTIAADASAGARSADVEAAFLDGAGEVAGAYPSDEAILGIDDGSVAQVLGPAVFPRRSEYAATGNPVGPSRGNARGNESANATEGHALPTGGQRPQGQGPALQKNHSDAAGVDDAGAANDAGSRNGAQGGAPPMPAWLAELGAASAPAASAELGALWQRATALDVFDRAYYGDDAGAPQQLVSELYAANPGALRAMFAAAANVLHGGGNGRGAENGSVAQGLGPAVFPRRGVSGAAGDGFGGATPMGGAENIGGERPQGQGPALHNSSAARGADANAHEQHPAADARTSHEAAQNAANAHAATARTASAAHFDAGAYANFERATNDAVVSDVTRAIERMLDRALPEGIADGARRRIAGDTLNEVHTALRGDRQLSAQVAETLRGGRFDDAAREQVARLIADRARGVVPAAAKHVIGEWTGSVLTTHRERSAKQRSTQSRVDITGGGLPQSAPRRAVRPADVDYRATTDDEILSW
jgi:hypothetical protein